MNRTMRMTAIALLAATMCAPALAAEPTMPDWDQLNTETQAMLVAPTRDHWNSNPEGRERMLQRAKRWSTLTPEQRGHARQGMDRWNHMTPEQKGEARALYAKMRGMDPEARTALRNQWRQMTPAQRRTWVEANPAPAKSDRPR